MHARDLILSLRRDANPRYIVSIRFFRNLVASQDDFYIKHITEKQVLGPILDVLIETMPRDNLLSSACLELFEYIKKENVKDLVKDLAQNYRERIAALSYTETFRDIVFRYDQSQSGTMEYFLESEDDGTRRPLHANTRMMEHIAIDAAEEEYWNTSDDDDGPESKALDRLPANGASASSTSQHKPLVDYTSDEEADDENTAEKLSRDGNAELNDGVPSQPTTPQPVTGPPERLSEKRRREEEDDDELGKIMQNKRRNSSSAGSNASVASAGTAKRRKSLTERSSPSTAPRKISISISPSLKTGGNARSDGES